ncbi:MAG: hypothetical protein J0G30_11700 [Actinomycetales bacterium]|nr:hypothetical protein [Actinomycetales bacterium]
MSGDGGAEPPRGNFLRRIREVVWGRDRGEGTGGRTEASVLRRAAMVPPRGLLVGHQWEPDPSMERYDPAPTDEVPWELRDDEA